MAGPVRDAVARNEIGRPLAVACARPRFLREGATKDADCRKRAEQLAKELGLAALLRQE